MKLFVLIFLISFNTFNTFAIDFIGLDVRTKGETINNPAPGSFNIPISELTKSTLKGISKDKSLKVFCEAGGRANKALRILKANGYNKIENIGSWREWNQLSRKK
jgi:rhodanese-related sulfurtransferase